MIPPIRSTLRLLALLLRASVLACVALLVISCGGQANGGELRNQPAAATDSRLEEPRVDSGPLDTPGIESAAASSPLRSGDIEVTGGLEPGPSFESGEYLTSEPVQWGRFVVVGSASGAVIAFDTVGRQSVWRTELGPPIESLAVSSNWIFAAAGFETARLRPATGEVVWITGVKAVEGSRSATPITRTRGTVYRAFTDGRVVAMDAETGAQRWQSQLGATPVGSMPVSDGVLYVCSEQGSLHALDGTTGETAWVHRTAGSFAAGPAIVDGRIVLATVEADATVLDPSGAVLAAWPTGGQPVLVPVVAQSDGVVVASAAGTLRAFDFDGAELWRADLTAHLAGHPGRSGGVLFAGEATGGLVSIDIDTGQTLSRAALAAAPAGEAALAERALLLVLSDGTVRQIGVDGEVSRPPLFTAEGSWVLPESGTFRLEDRSVALNMRSDRDAVFDIAVTAAPAEELVLRVVSSEGATVATNLGKVELTRSVRAALDARASYELVVERPEAGREVVISVETEQLQ